MKLKWYNYMNIRTKEWTWWTRRDANGVYFEIRKDPISQLFCLYVNGYKKDVLQSLSSAQRIANDMWEEGRTYNPA